MSNSVNRKSNNNKGKQGLAKFMVPKIPQLMLNPAVTRTYRFVQTGSGNTSITANSLISSLGGIATLIAGTTLASIFTSVKIHSIRMWGPVNPSPTSSIAPSVELNWAGGTLAPNKTVSDTSNSTSVVPYLSSRPPKNSRASFWVSASSTGSDTETLIYLVNNTKGTILDITVSVIFQDIDSIGVTHTSSGLSSGYIYYSPLDSSGYYTIQSPLSPAP
jgi:hypothetical protein